LNLAEVFVLGDGEAAGPQQSHDENRRVTHGFLLEDAETF
jgi:hypothetical protein